MSEQLPDEFAVKLRMVYKAVELANQVIIPPVAFSPVRIVQDLACFYYNIFPLLLQGLAVRLCAGPVNDAHDVFGESCDVLRVFGGGLDELVGVQMVGGELVEIICGLDIIAEGLGLCGAVAERVVLPLESSVSSGR